MKKHIYYGASRSRIAFTPWILFIWLLPFVVYIGQMIWGIDFILPFILLLIFAAVCAFFIAQAKKRLLKKKMEEREVLARWSFDKEFWNTYQKAEFPWQKKIPVPGLIVGAILVLMGLMAFLINHGELLTTVLLIDAGILLFFLIWLFSYLRKRLAMRNPGDIILIRGGIYGRNSFTGWDGKTALFDGAVLEKKSLYSLVVIHYRLRSKLNNRIRIGELSVPVPDERIAEASSAVRQLNAQPYGIEP